MLKSMRRNNFMRNLIIFGIVILLASYVLVSFGQAPPKAQGDTITRFGSSSVKFRDALIKKENLRSRYRQISDDVMQNLVTNYLVSDALMINGANRAGISVSDTELRDYIVDLRKTLAGDDDYLSSEQYNSWVSGRYRMQVEAFEEYLRNQDLKLQRFRRLFGSASFVSEDDIVQAFLEKNQSLEMELLSIPSSSVRNEVKFEDKALKVFFEANPDLFMSGNSRQVQYLQFTNAEFEAAVELTETEIVAFYNQNKEKPPYTTQERVRCSHILIKPEGRTDAEAKTEIERIRTEIEGGMVFADAAKKYSEDDSNASRGGDLGFATKGRFDPNFEKAAFELEPNVLSQPVKSAFGYHLIMVQNHQPETVQTLEEAREGIERKLKSEQSKNQARTAAAEFLAKVKAGAEFDAVATELGRELQTSDYFDDDNTSTISASIGANYRVRQEVFKLANLNDMTGVLDIFSGFVVAKWTDQKEPALLDFNKEKRRIQRVAETEQGRFLIEETLAAIQKKSGENGGKPFSELIADYSFINAGDAKIAPPFGSTNLPNEFTQGKVRFDDLFQLEEGNFYGPFISREQPLVLTLARVKTKKVADMEKLEDSRAELTNSLRSETELNLTSAYLMAQQEALDPNKSKQARIKSVLKGI